MGNGNGRQQKVRFESIGADTVRWADQVGSMLAEFLPRRNRIIWRETFGQL